MAVPKQTSEIVRGWVTQEYQASPEQYVNKAFKLCNYTHQVAWDHPTSAGKLVMVLKHIRSIHSRVTLVHRNLVEKRAEHQPPEHVRFG